MNARLRSLTLLATLALALPALAAPNEPVAKPVKTVVQSVRYSKDDIALKQFANEEQGRFLLGEDWDKGTDAQRKEFTKLFNSLFAKIAFPKVRENFKNLASITYEDPAVEGDKANGEVHHRHRAPAEEAGDEAPVLPGQGPGRAGRWWTWRCSATRCSPASAMTRCAPS